MTKRPAPKRIQGRALAPSAHRAALARFTRRLSDLVLAYTRTGRATTNLRRSVFRLKNDIDAWRARSGADDVRTTLSTRRATENGSWTCDECALVMISRGRFCYLIACDETAKHCSYVCVDVPTNHERRARSARSE